jgi:hypothetical protein
VRYLDDFGMFLVVKAVCYLLAFSTNLIIVDGLCGISGASSGSAVTLHPCLCSRRSAVALLRTHTHALFLQLPAHMLPVSIPSVTATFCCLRLTCVVSADVAPRISAVRSALEFWLSPPAHWQRYFADGTRVGFIRGAVVPLPSAVQSKKGGGLR